MEKREGTNGPPGKKGQGESQTVKASRSEISGGGAGRKAPWVVDSRGPSTRGSIACRAPHKQK